MIKLAKTVSSRVSKRMVIFSTLLFLGSIISINILSAYLGRINNTQLLDFTIGYNSQTAYEVLESSGELGRAGYLELLKFDFFFPLIYTFFGSSLLMYLVKINELQHDLFFLSFYLPIGGMICDFIENILIIRMINMFPIQFGLFGDVSSVFTLFKFFFLGMTLFCALMLFLISRVKRVSKKGELH